MPKVGKPLAVALLVLGDKLIRSMIHQGQQFVRLVQDGGPITPGKYGCKESGNFNISFVGKLMRNGNRVGRYEVGLVVLLRFLFQKMGQCIHAPKVVVGRTAKCIFVP